MLDVVVERPRRRSGSRRGRGRRARSSGRGRRARGVRERKRVVEQVAAKQRRRPGDRVGEQQRGEVGAVVRAPDPEGRGDQLARPARRSACRCRRARRRRSRRAVASSFSGARRRPGRRARRNELRPGPCAGPLEVAVEAEPLVGVREHEPRVVADQLPHLADASRSPEASSRDHADPVSCSSGRGSTRSGPGTARSEPRRSPSRSRSEALDSICGAPGPGQHLEPIGDRAVDAQLHRPGAARGQLDDPPEAELAVVVEFQPVAEQAGLVGAEPDLRPPVGRRRSRARRGRFPAR